MPFPRGGHCSSDQLGAALDLAAPEVHPGILFQLEVESDLEHGNLGAAIEANLEIEIADPGIYIQQSGRRSRGHTG